MEDEFSIAGLSTKLQFGQIEGTRNRERIIEEVGGRERAEENSGDKL